MLIEFRVQNFRSIQGSQTLSYAATADRAHESSNCARTGLKSMPRVCKAAVVFGPNASGKTNVILALATFRDLVLHSTAFSDAQFAERYTPWRVDPPDHAPTAFEIDVLLDQVRYRYAVAYRADRIVFERLLANRTGKSQRWFERKYQEPGHVEHWMPFSASFNGPRETWARATRSKALFLTTAAQLNSERLAPLFDWFEHGLSIIFPDELADMTRLAARVPDPAFRAGALRLFRAADIPVEDIRLSDGERGPECFADPLPQRKATKPLARPTIEFLHPRHGLSPIWLNDAQQAAGTLRLLGLWDAFLPARQSARLLAIDGIDVDLHPLAVRLLLALIYDTKTTDPGTQVLWTSHTAALMDLDILRRDEIWLAQLDQEFATTLSRLSRLKARKGELIARGYLQGRYGAVPTIRSDLMTDRVS